MKDYKGIYYDNNKDTTKFYEYGAHFKYAELFERLKKLQKERNEDILLIENKPYTIQTENNIDYIELKKARKKYKLKTLAEKENIRYLNVKSILNKEDEDGNKVSINKEEDNNYFNQNRKKTKLMTHSLDKIRLPNINFKSTKNAIIFRNKLLNLNNKLTMSNNNIKQNINITLKNNPSNKSLDKQINIKNHKNKFPIINSFYNNTISQQETENNQNTGIEAQSTIKIFRNNNKALLKPILVSKDNYDENIEIGTKYKRKKEKLVSIFEKEKQIKNNNSNNNIRNNNLFLGEKKNYSYNRKEFVNNDEMSKKIYNLKKKIFGDNNAKTKKF